MRRVSAMAVVLVAGGCVSEEMRWERPGAANTTIVRDASDCSAIAWTEAERLHPYGAGAPMTGATVDSAWLEQRQRVDAQRFATAGRLDDLCMQNRGYRKVPVKAP
jgi:hypothetical protein